LALIYPSSYEGFGIPIVEAMRCMCPVISLNNSSIPEVSGGAAILHNSLNLDDFIESIKSDSINNIHRLEMGYKNSMNFTWDKTYKKTKSVYNLFK
jgi:mannosyltransferase